MSLYIILSLNSIIFIVLISLLIFFLKNKMNINKDKLNIERIEKFPSYLTLLQNYMDAAYNIIYKERIMVYSIEASKLSENELDTVAKDYISLTLKFIGPILTNEFVKLYGDIDTLYFVIGQKFYEKYEDDKIREGATDNVMNYDYDFSDEENENLNIKGV